MPEAETVPPLMEIYPVMVGLEPKGSVQVLGTVIPCELMVFDKVTELKETLLQLVIVELLPPSKVMFKLDGKVLLDCISKFLAMIKLVPPILRVAPVALVNPTSISTDPVPLTVIVPLLVKL